MTQRSEGAGGLRVSVKSVVAVLIVVALVLLVALNSQTVELHLVFATVHWPLWLLLTIVIALSLGVGYLLGSQRAKARR